MKNTHMLKLVVGLTSTILLMIFILFIFFYRKRMLKNGGEDIETMGKGHGDEAQIEDLVTFQDGEDLTICDILDAPGEVIGKSNYGTLYKALLQQNNNLRLLRFLRPVCTTRGEEFGDMIWLLGCIRHPNLVPLLGFYAGPRGEKLLVNPFFRSGNLAEFIRGKLHSFWCSHLLYVFLIICWKVGKKYMWPMLTSLLSRIHGQLQNFGTKD
jgi:hypothetical protein